MLSESNWSPGKFLPNWFCYNVYFIFARSLLFMPSGSNKLGFPRNPCQNDCTKMFVVSLPVFFFCNAKWTKSIEVLRNPCPTDCIKMIVLSLSVFFSIMLNGSNKLESCEILAKVIVLKCLLTLSLSGFFFYQVNQIIWCPEKIYAKMIVLLQKENEQR